MKSVTRSVPMPPIPLEIEAGDSPLDLVVPFTTPRLTQDALNAANRLGANLCARIRLVRPIVVPYPLELDEPPVPLEFLRAQGGHFRSSLPLDLEIRLTRDANNELMVCLRHSSVVILATRKRPWITRTERLARAIRRTGHAVLMVEAEREN